MQNSDWRREAPKGGAKENHDAPYRRVGMR
jgi:hypothetical protein